MTPPSAKIALIGAGRVGTAVARLASEAGYEVVGVASRTSASASRASALLGAPVFTVPELPGADVYLLGATDRGIAELVVSLKGLLPQDSRVVHLSGALGIEVLSPLDDRVEGLALHPVQSCPDIETALRRLPGSTWGVTCMPGVREWAHGFVTALQGYPVDVPEEARPAWHAASVLVSNGFSALLAAGEGVLAGIGIAEPATVLNPLAEGSLANAREGGGGAATLTGPVVRGEVEAVARHLTALAEDPDLLDAYKRVGGLIVAMARGTGRITEEEANSMEALLES